MHDWQSLSNVPWEWKYHVAFLIGFLKGKGGVCNHWNLLGNKRVAGFRFWSRGYCVSTVGLGEGTIIKYFRIRRNLRSNI